LFAGFAFCGFLLLCEFALPADPGLELEPLGEDGEFCSFVPGEFPEGDGAPEPDDCPPLVEPGWEVPEPDDPCEPDCIAVPAVPDELGVTTVPSCATHGVVVPGTVVPGKVLGGFDGVPGRY